MDQDEPDKADEKNKKNVDKLHKCIYNKNTSCTYATKIKKKRGKIMKKIVNGKMYNTSTAEYIASNGSRGLSPSDFNYVENDLYKKKTGEFFITKGFYVMCEGWKSEIKTNVTEKEVKKFLENGNHIEEYEKLFGEPEE